MAGIYPNPGSVLTCRGLFICLEEDVKLGVVVNFHLQDPTRLLMTAKSSNGNSV